jgi:hypothetical protein
MGQSLEELLQAHETTSSQLRTLDVEIAVRHAGSPEVIRRDWWRRRGPIETYTARTPSVKAGKSIESLLVVRLDHAKCQMQFMEIGDESQLLTILPFRQHGLRAYEAPFYRNLLEFQCHSYFLLRIGLNALDDWRTLRELIEESMDPRILATDERVGEAKCYHIVMTHPGVGGAYTGQLVHVFLNPDAGFLIRKLVIDRTGQARASGTGEPRQQAPSEAERLVIEVDRVVEFGSGVFLPADSTSLVLLPDGRRHGEMRFSITKAAVNEMVDDVKLAISYPENSIVQIHDQPVSPRVKVSFPSFRLMGKGGQVQREFPKGGKELSQYVMELMPKEASISTPTQVLPIQVPTQAATAESQRRVYWYRMVIVGAACVALAVIAWRSLTGLSQQ